MKTLTARLTDIQQEHQWTDGEMATALGITRSGWSHIRSGRRRIGPATLRMVLARFPELRDAPLISLDAGVTDSTVYGAESTDAPVA